MLEVYLINFFFANKVCVQLNPYNANVNFHGEQFFEFKTKFY